MGNHQSLDVEEDVRLAMDDLLARLQADFKHMSQHAPAQSHCQHSNQEGETKVAAEEDEIKAVVADLVAQLEQELSVRTCELVPWEQEDETMAEIAKEEEIKAVVAGLVAQLEQELSVSTNESAGDSSPHTVNDVRLDEVLSSTVTLPGEEEDWTMADTAEAEVNAVAADLVVQPDGNNAASTAPTPVHSAKKRRITVGAASAAEEAAVPLGALCLALDFESASKDGQKSSRTLPERVQGHAKDLEACNR